MAGSGGGQSERFFNLEQLGEFHGQKGLAVQIVTSTQVFNEFSCGRPEPTAIRDFMKMLYDRGTPDTRPKLSSALAPLRAFCWSDPQ